MKEKVLPFLSLFTSLSTLVCCAIPALLVTFGLGAALAGLVTEFPQFIWMSEHKLWFFGAGAAMLVAAGVAQWHARNLPCPLDPVKAQACDRARRWSKGVYLSSVVIYVVGTVFAFGGLG